MCVEQHFRFKGREILARFTSNMLSEQSNSADSV